jgi:hypothetical protein
VHVRVTDAVLAGAAGKACGQLRELDVSDCGDVTFDALLAVVQANGGALQELRVGAHEYGEPQTLHARRVEQLLQAAPQLVAWHADVLDWQCSVVDARRMLQNEPPFQPLRLRTLIVDFQEGADNEATVLALAADLAAHASLKHVRLAYAPLHMPAALDAVVDAALARGFVSLTFWGCRFSPASVPALARLLGGGTLTGVNISQEGQQLLDGPSAALLAAALRDNSTLTHLRISGDTWRDTAAAAVLLGALTGHRSLRTLDLSDNYVLVEAPAAGAAIGALVAANAPALTELDVSWSSLGDAGLRPLFDALPRNTHLHELDISYNGMSEAFVRDVLLPAVRANASLRTLHARSAVEYPGVAEAIALVAARGGGGGGAV